MSMKFSTAKGDVDVIGKAYEASMTHKRGHIFGYQAAPLKRGTWVDRPGRGYLQRLLAKREKEQA